jgi:transcriptional regulator with XRE-family HTH domain
VATLSTRSRRRLAKRCRDLRAKAELSQLDVALSAQTSTSYYQKLERGILDPKLSTLIRLARIYGVTLCELIDGL